ncbi:unnamed protein product [Nezara viridula]|uniref:Neuropeptide n=1 Tax=Nezara viridula TaxID=85310 RepID=A0A9P0MTX5_NEZVI|nr:unnamed protein product [Nezara viridula]
MVGWGWAILLLAVEASAHFTSQWAAHIEGGLQEAQRIAGTHGFVVLAEPLVYTTELEDGNVLSTFYIMRDGT